jgi:CHAT domain-containing protein
VEAAGRVASGGAAPPSPGAAPAAPDAAEAQPDPPTDPLAAELPGTRAGPDRRAFAPLPEAVAEAGDVAGEFAAAFPEAPAPVVLTGAAAGREALSARVSGARFLHLATHGFVSAGPGVPAADPRPIDVQLGVGVFVSDAEALRGLAPMLHCGVALAGADLPPADDGRPGGLLTGEEVAALDLGACELAVLSTCDSALGVSIAGRGIASLQRALLAAGARQALTSLWKVPDASARVLFQHFYRLLWRERLPVAEALRRSPLLLRSARKPDGRPAFSARDWAGWVLIEVP